MLQKRLLVVTVVLLAGAGYGSDNVTPPSSTVGRQCEGSSPELESESDNWPVAYDYQDICVSPVNTDVGLRIEVVNAQDLALTLQQVEVHKYSGTVAAQIVCNVNIQLSVAWSKKSNIDLGSYGSSVSVSLSSLDAPGGTVAINLTLSQVDLSNLQGSTNCLEVGTVTLKVCPNMNAQLASGYRS